jgi:hypothetical protein
VLRGLVQPVSDQQRGSRLSARAALRLGSVRAQRYSAVRVISGVVRASQRARC